MCIRDRSRVTEASKVVCVRPTIPSNIRCDCPTSIENDCYTLNEWIDSGISPFSGNFTTVTMMLLAGVHLVNSTKDRFLIENVLSVELTGEHETTNVLCISQLWIGFLNVENVNISNIVFNSCFRYSEVFVMNSSLFFANVQNVVVSNLTINKGGLIIWQSRTPNIIALIMLHSLNIYSDGIGLYYFSESESDASLDWDRLHIMDSTFHRCSIQIELRSQHVHSILDVQRVSIIGHVHSVNSALSQT